MPFTCPVVEYVDNITEHEVCQHKSLWKMLEVLLITPASGHIIIGGLQSPKKIKDMIIIFSQEHLSIPNIIIVGEVIEHVSTSRLLGLCLSWGVHFKEIHKGLVKSYASSYYSTDLQHQQKTIIIFLHI